MTTDAYIRVICDGCSDEEEIQLTATARCGYDCRNVASDIESCGWVIEGDEHYCGNCATKEDDGTPPAGDAPSLTPLPGLRSGSAISAAPSGGLERTGSEDD